MVQFGIHCTNGGRRQSTNRGTKIKSFLQSVVFSTPSFGKTEFPVILCVTGVPAYSALPQHGSIPSCQNELNMETVWAHSQDSEHACTV